MKNVWTNIIIKEDCISFVEGKSVSSCDGNAFKFSSVMVGTRNSSIRERQRKDAMAKIQKSYKFLQAKKHNALWSKI